MTQRLAGAVAMTSVCALVGASAARAQFGRGGDWTTGGNDAQRSSWVRTDPKISLESMQKPDFQFLWKMKLNNEPRQLNSLTPPVLMDRYIGYKGFRSLGFVGGSSDKIFVIDTDLARMEWQVQLTPGSPPQGGSQDCPGGLTSALTRHTIAAMTPPPQGRGGFGGRGGPARSGVGEADEGAVTLAQSAARSGASFPAPPPAARRAPGVAAGPGSPRVSTAAFSGGFGTPAGVFALSGDGKLRFLNVANGAEIEPPVTFLPPNANAHGLIVVDDLAYVATTNGCGGVANGVWSLDLGAKQVATWESKGGVSGSTGPAIGPDGTLYVATTEGELAALEPKTLKLKASYTAGQQGFTSSPVIFEYKGKTLLAVTSKDGWMHLLDTSALGGVDGKTPLSKTPIDAKAKDFVAGALASWLDAGGTRWVLAPTAGAVAALKVVERNGAPALEPGWVSRAMVSPLPPMIINGVVFAASGGTSPAVLYALDGSTGKELWNSGRMITSSARGGLSGGGSQVYLGTHDGTLYAFGFPIEH